MTTSNSNPKITIDEYDVIVYPATYGTPSQAFAMVYRTGKAVWETLSFDTVEQAIDAAREWITDNRNAVAYQTYREASQAVIDGKAMLKVLRQEGGQAAERAKHETIGTMEEKLTAIRAAWAPFNEKIAQAEAEIEKNYAIADENFDAWKGLNQ